MSIFYKKAIGQLILWRDLSTASAVLKAVFIVATYETDGRLINSNVETECEKQRKLQRLIDPYEQKEDIDEILNNNVTKCHPEDKNIFDDDDNDEPKKENC